MADLITLAEYKTAKGISSTNEDTRLTPLIVATSKFIRAYCGRSFTEYYSADKIEYFSIFWAEHFIQVSESPIIAVTEVAERETLTSAYVPLTSYYVDPDSDAIYKVSENGVNTQSYLPGNGSVKVTYRAGWSTAPEDVKQAAIDLVTYYFKEEYKPNKAIGASSMQNSAQDNSYQGASLPPHIKRVLDLYRVI